MWECFFMLNCRAGNVHIALRERVDGHGLSPVEGREGCLHPVTHSAD